MKKISGAGAVSLLLAASMLLAGCSGKTADTPVTDAGTEPAAVTAAPADTDTDKKQENSMMDMSKFRVGGSVSDAYVDPSKIDVIPEDQIKAKGFEYDYDSLTYDLVWSDEFDYEGLPDDTKWDYDTGASGWGNDEMQFYTRDANAYVKDGLLTITARKEDHEGAKYTSARMVSRGKGDWLYGKFEIRAKLPAGRGTWPAIWMLPTDWSYGGWPASGEIDIMEHVGYDMNTVHYSIHTQSYYHSIGTQKTATSKVSNVDEEFHVYALEWLPDKLIFFVDGEKTFTYEPVKYKSTPTYKEWPFDKRFHLLLNVAVGGFWGGAMGVDEDIWPQSMEVDYVRVYQSPQITAITQ